jgi:hypothetical protein
MGKDLLYYYFATAGISFIFLLLCLIRGKSLGGIVKKKIDYESFRIILWCFVPVLNLILILCTFYLAILASKEDFLKLVKL